MARGPSTICATIAVLMTGGGTYSEITARVGNKTSKQISGQIRTLHKHGLVYIREWKRNSPTGPWMVSFEMQTTPFEFPDAPKPPKKTEQEKWEDRKRRAEVMAIAVLDSEPFPFAPVKPGITRHHCL